MTGGKNIEPYIVIMCGGGGARMVPLSTEKKPKQFHTFVKDLTLLQSAFARVGALARRENIFVSTIASYVDLVRAQLPDLPENNIIVEPCARDTMPAVAYVAHVIYGRDHDAIIMTAPADHAIKNLYDFVKAVQTGFSVVDQYPERVGLLGIEPTEPDTSLGYIRKGSEILDFCHVVYGVDDFKEKPDQKTATTYCSSGDYYWNGGYFIFNAQTVLDLVAEFAPHVTDVLAQMQENHDAEDRHMIFSTLSKEPFDKAILEKISPQQRFMVPANLGWSDLGTWESVFKYLPKDEWNNVCRGTVSAINSRGNLLWATKKRISTLGVNDIGIVENGDEIVVFSLSQSHEMKKIVLDK